MFIATLFIMAPNWKQLSTNKRMSEHTVVYEHNGILLSNKNELLLHMNENSMNERQKRDE